MSGGTAEIETDVLVGACRIVAPALGSRLTVHANFRLRSTVGGLTLEARSDEFHIVHLLPSGTAAAELDALIPGVMLQRWLRTVTHPTVRLSHDSETSKVSISSGKMVLTLNVESPSGWPIPASGSTESWVLSHSSVSRLNLLAYAAATDPSRNVLTGVLLDGDFAGASDNTRASSATLAEALPRIILPPELVGAVAREIGGTDATLEVGTGRVALRTSTTSWGSQQIPDTYPDLRALVDRPTRQVARLNAGILRESLTSAAAFDKDGHAQIAASLDDGQVVVQMKDTELGDFVDALDATVERDETCTVLLSDLRSALGAVTSETVVVCVTTSNKHLVLIEEGASQFIPLKAN